jgi:hypothetical protein
MPVNGFQPHVKHVYAADDFPQIPFQHQPQRHDQRRLDDVVQRQVTVARFNQRIVDDVLNLRPPTMQGLAHGGLLAGRLLTAKLLFITSPPLIVHSILNRLQPDRQVAGGEGSILYL